MQTPNLIRKIVGDLLIASAVILLADVIAVMQELLIGRGVPESSMILEDRAESTEENFANTLRLVDPESPVVLITSNYHMDRAKGIAESAGFRTVLRHPAPSDFRTLGASVMWEVVLDLNSLGK